MSIKQNGGVFGRNPTFNDVTIEGQLTFDGDIDINSDLTVDGTIKADSVLVDTATNNYTGTPLAVGDNTKSQSGLNIQTSPTGYGYILFGDGAGASSYIGQINYNHSNDKMTLKTAGNDRAVIDANGINVAGNVIIGTSGKGIDFSATAGTGTSELLSDYEEGVWTPAPASGTLTINDATYTKVGRLVTAQADVTATATTSGDWSGLPFNLGGSLSADKQVGFVGYQSEESSAVWGVLADNTLATFTFRNGSTSKQLTTGSRAVFTIIYYTN